MTNRLGAGATLFTLAVLVLLLTGARSFWNALQLDEASQWTIHTYTVIERSNHILSRLRDAESGARGYALTGEDVFLQPYTGAGPEIKREIADLKALTQDDARHLASLEKIGPILDRKVEVMEGLVRSRREKPGVPPDVELFHVGRALMDELRVILDDFTREEREHLTERAARKQSRATLMLWFSVAGTVAGLVFVGVAGVIVRRELLARRRSEAELRNNLAFTRAISVALGEGLYALDAAGHVAFMNTAAEKALGWTEAELRGKDIHSVIHFQDAAGARVPASKCALLGVLRSGTPFVSENESFTRKDGVTIPVSLTSTPILVGGKIAGAVVAFADVSEKKRHGEALEANEAQTRSIIENMLVGLLTIDEQGVIESANPAAERIFGYPRQELIGQNIGILLVEPASGAFSRGLGKVTELQGKRKDGARVALEISFSDFQTPRGPRVASHVRDISDRRAIDRVKAEFVSTVSHELRTPLTSIQGALGLVLGGAVGEVSPQAKGCLQIAHRNGERLIRLVNDILDLEKIESGQVEFVMQSRELRVLVEQAIDSNRAFGAQFGVRFELEGEPGPLMVLADSDRLTQVLTNLLSNAAKFSPKDSVVTVVIERIAKRIRVSVRDHGPGIPESFRGRIFTRFAQADSSDTRQKAGTGLGLNISKLIVERHHGHIGFDSTAGAGTTLVGAGTTFWFDLPELSPKETVSKAPMRPAVTRSGSVHRVLVYEDDHSLANHLTGLLERSGFVADLAPSAAEAHALLGARTYSAVMIDFGMKNAVPFVREMRSDDSGRDVPIVVVSGQAVDGQPAIQSGFGIVDWLTKPIDDGRLLSAITKATNASAATRPRILHVEDDADVLSVVATILRNVATVVPARSVQKARALIAKERFDLVLLDIALPDGQGLGLVQLLNSSPSGAVPVIVFSATELPTAALKGVHEALVKSKTSNEQLLETIKSFVRSEA